mgnify:CR=1 FL=1
MTTLEILKDARELVAQGWCQCAHARSETGRALDIWTKPSGCAYCAEGALIMASCATEDQEEITDAWNVLREVVGTKSLYLWNDAPGRTKAEILAAFDEAIEKEIAK